MDPLLIVLGIIGILVGLAGIVLPVVPGSLVVWLATAGTFLLHRSDAVGWGFAAALAVLAIAGSAATYILPARTGLASGAAPSSLAVAVVAAIIGFFVIPVAGVIVGFLVGLLLAERARHGDWVQARRATGQVVGAYGIGVLIDLASALVMASVWVIAVVLSR